MSGRCMQGETLGQCRALSCAKQPAVESQREAQVTKQCNAREGKREDWAAGPSRGDLPLAAESRMPLDHTHMHIGKDQ